MDFKSLYKYFIKFITYRIKSLNFNSVIRGHYSQRTSIAEVQGIEAHHARQLKLNLYLKVDDLHIATFIVGLELEVN